MKGYETKKWFEKYKGCPFNLQPFPPSLSFLKSEICLRHWVCAEIATPQKESHPLDVQPLHSTEIHRDRPDRSGDTNQIKSWILKLNKSDAALFRVSFALLSRIWNILKILVFTQANNEL